MKVLHVLAQLPVKTGSGVYFTNVIDGLKNYEVEQAAIYGTTPEYDFNISEAEKELEDINIKKKEAIKNFDNSTRHIIADEILTAAKPKIDELDSRRVIISSAINRVSKELKDKNIYISENYEVYLGREFLDVEKIDALANIMDKAIVTNLREAIEEYRNSMEV